MARYFLTGGRQRVSTLFRREEWTSFDRAVLATLDDLAEAGEPLPGDAAELDTFLARLPAAVSAWRGAW